MNALVKNKYKADVQKLEDMIRRSEFVLKRTRDSVYATKLKYVHLGEVAVRNKDIIGIKAAQNLKGKVDKLEADLQNMEDGVEFMKGKLKALKSDRTWRNSHRTGV
jgi:hypothetical protein